MDKTVGQVIKEFLLSLLSRKFLLSIAGAYIAFESGMADGSLSQPELLLVLTPILGFLGVEGFADIKSRELGK